MAVQDNTRVEGFNLNNISQLRDLAPSVYGPSYTAYKYGGLPEELLQRQEKLNAAYNSGNSPFENVEFSAGWVAKPFSKQLQNTLKKLSPEDRNVLIQLIDNEFGAAAARKFGSSIKMNGNASIDYVENLPPKNLSKEQLNKYYEAVENSNSELGRMARDLSPAEAGRIWDGRMLDEKRRIRNDFEEIGGDQFDIPIYREWMADIIDQPSWSNLTKGERVGADEVVNNGSYFEKYFKK